MSFLKVYLPYSSHNVRLGEYDTSNEIGERDCVDMYGGYDCTEGGVVIPIEKIIPHPDYDHYHNTGRHDIALLRTSNTAPYTGKSIQKLFT